MDASKSVDRLRAQLAQLEGLVADRAAGDRRVPSISGWSVAEHVEHLARAHGAIFARLIQLTEPDDPTSSGGRVTLLGLVVLLVGRIPRGRGKAPAPSQPIGGGGDARAQLEAARVQLEQLADRTDRLAASRGRFGHPYFGRLHPRQWLRFAEIHADHHLRIAREIVRWAGDGRGR